MRRRSREKTGLIFSRRARNSNAPVQCRRAVRTRGRVLAPGRVVPVHGRYYARGTYRGYRGFRAAAAAGRWVRFSHVASIIVTRPYNGSNNIKTKRVLRAGKGYSSPGRVNIVCTYGDGRIGRFSGRCAPRRFRRVRIDTLQNARGVSSRKIDSHAARTYARATARNWFQERRGVVKSNIVRRVRYLRHTGKIV